MASAPSESKPPTVPPPPPAVPAAPPTASAPPPADKAPTQAAATPLKPSFDVVNVDPSGEAVIAGRSAPNAKVELRDAGKTVAEATADAAGQFVIIPPALAPGDHSLSLAASADKTQPAISSPVAISVPAPPEAKVAASPPPSEPKAAAAASSPTNAAAPAPPAPGDADRGDALVARRLPRRHKIGRGRRRRRAHGQGFGRAECDGPPLSQRRRRRRRQDASGRPLVADDQKRHDPGRLPHARR